MTSEMKSFLLCRIQEAIDEAVSESDLVSDIVAEMKEAGYELCIVLQSTVTISPSEELQRDAVPDPRLLTNVSSDVPSNGDIELTGEDLAFLQELNISV
jgi:hypothetical protein